MADRLNALVVMDGETAPAVLLPPPTFTIAAITLAAAAAAARSGVIQRTRPNHPQ